MYMKILATGGALMFCLALPVQADKALAHSKSLGMSFTALGDPWCGELVRLRVDAKDDAQFSSMDYRTTLQKLGQVLNQECQQAASIMIDGMVAGEPVWSGTASREGGWIAQEKPVVSPEMAAATTAAATPEQSAPQMPATVVPIAREPEQQSAPSGLTTGGLVIAGWQPGGGITVTEHAGTMAEITSHETGCNIRTYVDIKPELKPTFTTSRESTCKNGYVQTTEFKGTSVTKLFYQGQKQPFASIHGNWHDGYNLDRGYPKQIVSRYKAEVTGQWNRPASVEQLLVWAGEAPALRAHFFSTYTYKDHADQWQWDKHAPFIVLTDNEALKQNPQGTGLADSLVAMYEAFTGDQRFNSVSFVITDKMHQAPTQAYQLAMKGADPDPSFYMAGRAVHHRGMPWAIEVSTDFVAKRAAFVEAERQRAEAERQRAEAEKQQLVALRARHQDSLDQQLRQLETSEHYDRLRFYATLMLERDRIDRAKINFASPYVNNVNPLSHAVAFSHPAQFVLLAQDDEVNIGSPMYMLIEADDGKIEKPYPMRVDYSETSQKIDGWMLVRAAPKFGYEFSDSGDPVFSITIQEAVPCKSAQCLDEMDAASMMRAWYDDEDMDFTATRADLGEMP